MPTEQPILQDILTSYNKWGTDEEKEVYIDKLEELITKANKELNKGKEIIPDSIYDTCIDYLRALKPDSPLLHHVWSEDDDDIPLDEDLDRHLISHPMMSIQTIKYKTDKAYQDFKASLPTIPTVLNATVKLNGFGVRLVLKDGYVVKGHSRGRSTNGKDYTKQLITMLDNDFFSDFEDLGIVEIRGEVLLPFSHFEKAKQFNPNIKTAFTGVSSMIRESASPEEWGLLRFVAYDVIGDHPDLKFNSLTEKLDFLDDAGFEVPLRITKSATRHTFDKVIDLILEIMESNVIDDDNNLVYDYYTDGVVVAVDDNALFEDFGAEDKFRLGNIALKIGYWEQNGYVGTIGEIKWTKGKSKKTPVAVLEEPVLTATGQSVQNIPLYAPCYILMLDAYPGNDIHFRYGGEAGVVPTTPDGRLVTETPKVLNVDEDGNLTERSAVAEPTLHTGGSSFVFGLSLDDDEDDEDGDFLMVEVDD